MDELNPVGLLDHEYVSPLIEGEPTLMLSPLHIVVSFPALTAGSGLIETTTESEMEQPVEALVLVTV